MFHANCFCFTLRKIDIQRMITVHVFTAKLPKWFGERPGKKAGDPETPEGEEDAKAGEPDEEEIEEEEVEEKHVEVEEEEEEEEEVSVHHDQIEL